MTLIELIEYASEYLRMGIARATIDLEFARMGVDPAVAAEILHTLNDDGTFFRVNTNDLNVNH
jgi:hypothetical protein